MFQTKAVQKIRTHILCSIVFSPRKSCRFVYEIMWENLLERCRLQMIIERTRITCRITEATVKHSEYATRTAIHGYSGYAKAPQCNVIERVAWLPAQSCPPIYTDHYTRRVVLGAGGWGRQCQNAEPALPAAAYRSR